MISSLFRREFLKTALAGCLPGWAARSPSVEAGLPARDEFRESTDAAVWADAFCRIVGNKIPAIRDQRDWMIGWFANAIMAGWDESHRRSSTVPDFDDLGRVSTHNINGKISKDQLLFQCIAIISTHPKYEHLVPQEVYEAVIRHSEEVHAWVSDEKYHS